MSQNVDVSPPRDELISSRICDTIQDIKHLIQLPILHKYWTVVGRLNSYIVD
jgi:hypothetical protein